MSALASSSFMGRMNSAGCTPLRLGSMNGPSTWIPSAPGTRSRASRAAASAASSTRGASVTTVGRKAVTPARRCAAAMAAIPSKVGLALNSAPPPPLICQSTKPGLKIPPPRSTCSRPRGRSSKVVSAWIEPPSTTSAQSSCIPSPSKMRAPVRTFIARLPFAARRRRQREGSRHQSDHRVAARAARREPPRNRAA